MTMPSTELFRIDPLTGCKTFLSFIEELANLPLTDLPLDYPITESLPHTEWPHNSSLLFVEINHMKLLNKAHGHAYGDSAIRWLGLLLTEESGATVYRIGGVEFAVLLTSATFTDHEEVLQRILARIEKEAKSMEMADPAVHVALIHYRQSSHSGPDNVLMQMSEAMLKIKNTAQTTYKIFMAEDLKVAALALTRWTATNESDVTYQTRWIARKNVQHALWMGRKLDQIQQEAYTDAISGLPNMRAALLEIEHKLKSSGSNGNSFSVLLMDGDNIRIYNEINYAAGDVMIRDMSAVFRDNLRPQDFVARWRSGDEFIAVLPDTSSEGAKVVGERFRLAVKEASQNWRFPTSISIGIATYPKHGNTVNALVDMAESALKRGKDEGKDRVILAE
jgi:diguanylate cyclase (GGDEF)-like protein